MRIKDFDKLLKKAKDMEAKGEDLGLAGVAYLDLGEALAKIKQLENQAAIAAAKSEPTSESFESKELNTDQIPSITHANFVAFYANHAAFGGTDFDMTITLREFTATPPGEHFFNERAIVTLSWEFAKCFSNSLRKFINNNEPKHSQKHTLE